MSAVTLKDVREKNALRERVERDTQKYILWEKDLLEKRERESARKQLQRMKKKMSEDKTEEEKHLEKVNDLKRKNDKLRQSNHRLNKKIQWKNRWFLLDSIKVLKEVKIT